MVIDQLVEAILQKRNPCIVGIDPEWPKLPLCYRELEISKAEAVLTWAKDVIDAVQDIVPAVKPQMAFFEVFGWEGLQVHQQVVAYAHKKGLLVIDDSKRNDIGNTAAAYAFAHLAKDGPINADFLPVNPFLGSDSIAPFVETAQQHGKGLFVLVKTSNPSSGELSDAITTSGESVCEWLAGLVKSNGSGLTGRYGYSAIGAVVGATHPDEAKKLRSLMKEQFFLVPGYGAQGGCAADITGCFHPDGLGAVVSSSRGILYHYLQSGAEPADRRAYQADVRRQALLMRSDVCEALSIAYGQLAY
ncbi:MAG: orotidine-5'-phosphate decarboxylase [Clostridia bacterium]|nr:orotidine-5'-phosphate decarboxylase [Clostridia bacterium]